MKLNKSKKNSQIVSYEGE